MKAEKRETTPLHPVRARGTGPSVKGAPKGLYRMLGDPKTPATEGPGRRAPAGGGHEEGADGCGERAGPRAGPTLPTTRPGAPHGASASPPRKRWPLRRAAAPPRRGPSPAQALWPQPQPRRLRSGSEARRARSQARGSGTGGRRRCYCCAEPAGPDTKARAAVTAAILPARSPPAPHGGSAAAAPGAAPAELGQGEGRAPCARPAPARPSCPRRLREERNGAGPCTAPPCCPPAAELPAARRAPVARRGSCPRSCS